MHCSQYVAGFSDYLDGTAPEEAVRTFEKHLESCADCRRYRAVVERGAELLRALPEPELTEDFGPRLQHRLYHVDEQVALDGATSATPAMTVVGMAILLTAMAWSPTLWQSAPQVELAPIVVNQPPTRFPVRPVNAMPSEVPQRTSPDFDQGLWDEPHALMYEYSPLSQRYRRQGLVRRAGIDQDR